MKRKSLLIMLLVALFMPLAMNAQNGMPKKSMSSPVKKEIAQAITSNDRGGNATQSEIARVAPSNDRGDRASSTVTASKITAKTATWTGSAGENWNVNITISNTSGLNQNVTNGYAQYGNRNYYATKGTFSTSGISGTITSVAVDCASYQGNGTVSVTVGGAAFGGSQSIPSWSGTAGVTRTFTGSASGDIVVTMTNGSSTHRAMYIKSITVTYTSCGAPENLTISTTPTSATVTWEGDASSYNLQYRECAEETVYFSDNFESNSLDTKGWTTVRNGQGTTSTDWHTFDMSTMTDEDGNPAGIENHSGSYVVIGRSWASSAYGVDNWLITPQVTLDGTLKFWVLDDGTYHETYYVMVSTNTTINTDNVEDGFTLLSTPGNASDVWSPVTVDLSSYNGAQGYIAIRLQDYDKDYLSIDDFTISKTIGTPGAWSNIISVNGNSYTIEGLSEGTNYEVQVQGVCDGTGQSDWLSTTFSTPSYCDMYPTDLTVELTTSSAELSWTGYHDSYNVQYRIPAFDGYYINEPLTPDNIGNWGSLYADDNSGFYYTDNTQTDVCWVFSYNTNPPQYLFSPDFPRPTQHSETLTFDYKVASASYPETFEVLYFVGDDIVAEDAVTVSNTDWVQYTSEVPVGATSFVIAYLSNDMYRLYLDNFVIASDDPVTEGTDWMTATANGNTLSLGFTQLESESIYEWQVQGADCDGNGGTTDWSFSSFFTTPEIAAVLVTEIDVDPNAIEMNVGATYTILYTVLPADATNPAVTFSSSDATVATVDENGNVTGLVAGTAVITIAATDGSGVTGTFTVTVMNIDVEEITASDVTVMSGETATIEWEVLPATATIQDVTFTSANTAIATVDENGVVTGVGVGETTITIASVSNPDVTATITVTVTSDPTKVQFTVNAPVHAKPGDVITVEGVLTAPTEGTWNGFTGLILDLTYDNTAFEYVANSQSYGPVATQAQQNGAFMQKGTLDNAVQLAMVISDNSNSVTTEGVVFSAQFTVLAETGEYTFTAVPHDGNLSYDIELLAYEATPSTVNIALTKDIVGWSNAEQGASNFYLIASPVGDVAPTAVTIEGDATANMVSGTYDLYYFDHNRDLEWVNYKDANGNPGAFSLLKSGKGYLYANQNDVTLVFNGTGITSGTQTVALDYYEEGDDYNIDLPGWNLVGNPFAKTAYFTTSESGITTSFYTMDAYGVYVPVTNGSIDAMEGVFVHAEGEGQNVTFTTTQPTRKSPALNLNLSNGRRVVDRAIVRFDRGGQLPKLQFRQGSTKVYIPVEGQDYAIVSCEEMGELPVSFKAEENGSYNLSLSSEEVSFAYLHLIDNLTGADVDLLQTPSYSFEAKTTDYESRFKLVFATGDNSNSDNFAFFSNGSFVINNDGAATLQVIDVTGRILKSESINGCTNVNVNAAPGIYMLRLVNGDSVKVQKVVVK